MRLSGLLRNSLCEYLGALGLGLSLQSVISADSDLESFAASTSADMLNSDVNSLGDDSASVLLVDDHSYCMLSNIENTAGLSVVELEGHALVDAAVSNDINEVAFLVRLHDLRKVHGAMLSEGLGEEVSGSGSVSVTVRHLYFLIVK